MKIRSDLSVRESRIHSLMEQGFTAKMIADALGLHVRTATIYIANLKLIEATQDIVPADRGLGLSGSEARVL